jgi:hypothetical protein
MIISSVFLCGEFSPLGNKRKGLANPVKGILGFFFEKSPYSDQKKDRSSQIEIVCSYRSPELSRVKKKITCPPGQLPFTAN